MIRSSPDRLPSLLYSSRSSRANCGISSITRLSCAKSMSPNIVPYAVSLSLALSYALSGRRTKSQS